MKEDNRPFLIVLLVLFILFMFLYIPINGCTIGRIDVYEYARTGGDLTDMKVDETVWDREIDTWWNDPPDDDKGGGNKRKE
jgi:hypothetical protein